MNAERRRLIAAALAAAALPRPLRAQGFAGLGAEAEGYALPDRNRVLRFPQDHGAHPGFRIEWWYLTANLRDAAGTDCGLQWTLFRTALTPRPVPGPWEDGQLWLAHAAVTTPDRHLVAERFGRGGTGQAGVRAAPFSAWIDTWEMSAPDTPPERTPGAGIGDLVLRARTPDWSYALRLVADGPLVLHGAQGYSVKSPAGQASHYYSQPFYQAQGQLDLPDGRREVTGQAWLDREWSSQPLAGTQTGWDWISLHLEGGTRLMGFRLRDPVLGDFTSGSWIEADGTLSPFGDGVLRMTPLGREEVAGRQVPVRWQVDLPARGVSLRLDPVNPQAWMATSVPYWEGPMRISGSHGGRGYLEMTGYDA